MCGLVGYFTGFFGEKDKNALVDLMILSQLRGLDSTGVIRLHQEWQNPKQLSHDWEKEAVPVSTFLSDRKTELFTEPASKRMYGILVHARAATLGKVNNDNAHPFENDVFLGMHNGSIRGYFPENAFFETDSEAIYKNLEKHGIEGGLKKVNQAHDAAYALQFYNKDTGDIHFIRNDKRPLYMAFEKKTNTYIFASEKAFLKYIEDKYNFDFTRIILLSENVLYTLHKNKEYGTGYSVTEKRLDVKPPVKVNPPVQYTTPHTATAHPMGPGSMNYGGKQNTLWAAPKGIPNNVIKFPEKERLARLESARQMTPRPMYTGPSNPPKESIKERLARLESARQMTPRPKYTGPSNPPKESIVDKIVDKLEQEEVAGKVEHHAPFLLLDKFEWDKRVECGCTYCDQVPHYSTRGKMHWENDQDFLCSEFTNNPQIMSVFTFKPNHVFEN